MTVTIIPGPVAPASPHVRTMRAHRRWIEHDADAIGLPMRSRARCDCGWEGTWHGDPSSMKPDQDSSRHFLDELAAAAPTSAC